MNYLDPAKQARHRVILFVGYILIAIGIFIATVILLNQAYGFGIGKHFLIGGNVSYIFGNLQQTSSTEIPNLYGTLNSTIENSNSIGGFNYDYGAQYSFDFGECD